MTRLLLDTHVLLWWSAEPEKLPSTVHDAMREHRDRTFVSAVSAYEIALKHRIGKLPNVEGLIAELSHSLVEDGFQQMPVSCRHAIVAGGLDLRHKDPFDRLLIAQALVEKVTLVSKEDLFDSFGVDRLW